MTSDDAAVSLAQVLQDWRADLERVRREAVVKSPGLADLTLAASLEPIEEIERLLSRLTNPLPEAVD